MRICLSLTLSVLIITSIEGAVTSTDIGFSPIRTRVVSAISEMSDTALTCWYATFVYYCIMETIVRLTGQWTDIDLFDGQVLSPCFKQGEA